jgi:hypothetical protein
LFWITNGAKGDFSKAAWRVYTYFKQASENLFVALNWLYNSFSTPHQECLGKFVKTRKHFAPRCILKLANQISN